MKARPLIGCLTALAACLPGDHIHDLAPSSRPGATNPDGRDQALAEAAQKRRRKAEARKAKRGGA